MAPSARFTPSLLEHDALEDLFVCREHLVIDALDRIERAAAGPERSMRLFVGPRGAGKTHLISLIAHRARLLDGDGQRFQVAWLDEDPWAVDELDDLLREILDALEHQPDGSSDVPLERVRRAVRERGPIVVLIENLDQVLTALGRDGQRKLRALIENERAFLFIASTTRLSTALTNQNEPFYGAFDLCDLEPFAIDQAVQMLQHLARRNHDEQLAEALDTPAARRRLTAVNHLAGGQPRVWALLASGLTIGGLDELVDTLLTQFDDLTPYYQEQMRQLSGQERKVVRALSDAPGSRSVGQIAAAARLDEKSAARALTSLRRQGWARRRQGPIVDKADGRLTYYDLAEPLARLAFQIKAAHGRPIRTVIEFLKYWFTAEELEPLGVDPSVDAYLTIAGTEARSDRWLTLARSLADPNAGEIDPVMSRLAPPNVPDAELIAGSLVELDDALRAWQAGDPAALLDQPPSISILIDEELRSDSDGHGIRLRLARLALEVGETDTWVGRADAMLSTAVEGWRGEAARIAAAWHARAGSLEAVDALLGSATESADAEDLIWLAARLQQAGASEHALSVTETALTEAITPSQAIRLSLIIDGALLRLGRASEVIPLWRSTVDALDSFDPSERAVTTAQTFLADALLDAGAFGEAVELLEGLVDATRHETDADPSRNAHVNNLANAYRAAGRTDDALTLFRDLARDMSQVHGRSHRDTLTTLNNLGLTLLELGEADEASELLDEVLHERERQLGVLHPHTLTTANNLAGALCASGRYDVGVELMAETLARLDAAYGPFDPNTILAQANLGGLLADVGRTEEAIEALEHAKSVADSVLPPDHHFRRIIGEGLETLALRGSDAGHRPLGDDALGAEEGAELADE